MSNKFSVTKQDITLSLPIRHLVNVIIGSVVCQAGPALKGEGRGQRDDTFISTYPLLTKKLQKSVFNIVSPKEFSFNNDSLSCITSSQASKVGILRGAAMRLVS